MDSLERQDESGCADEEGCGRLKVLTDPYEAGDGGARSCGLGDEAGRRAMLKGSGLVSPTLA